MRIAGEVERTFIAGAPGADRNTDEARTQSMRNVVENAVIPSLTPVRNKKVHLRLMWEAVVAE